MSVRGYRNEKGLHIRNGDYQTMNELKLTKEWFEAAIPEPTIEMACVQIGCHFEEVAEMMDALNLGLEAEYVHELANQFKTKSRYVMRIVNNVDRKALADSMGDQQVTATGVMHCFLMNALGIIGEINRSNFSKFEDGKPIFNSNGKITKGKNYTPPKLDDFI